MLEIEPKGSFVTLAGLLMTSVAVSYRYVSLGHSAMTLSYHILATERGITVVLRRTYPLIE
jgi:hypothetical protein